MNLSNVRAHGGWMPLALALLAIAPYPDPATAQDRFGSDVAVVGDQVLALKSRPGRGPAAVHVFREVDGAWIRAARVFSPLGPGSGHALGARLGLDGERFIVASADPEAADGAYVYQRDADGVWQPSGRLALTPGGAGAPDEVTLGTVMSLLSPPARRAGLANGRALVALSGGSESALFAFERTGRGEWEKREVILAPGRAQAIASVVLTGAHAFLGAPAFEGSGAVFVLAADPDTGEWSEASKVDPEVEGSGFGSSIVTDGDALLIGAPGQGAVYRYARDADTGAWTLSVAVQGGTEGSRFGAALAAHGNQLLVGAPRSDEGRGAVYVYRRDATGTWRAAGALSGEGGEAGWSFGAAVGLGENLAVGGAPLADGGIGRVAVFSRSSGGTWGEPTWLALPEARLDPIVEGETRCEDGRAAGFACSEVDLQAFLPPTAFGGGAGEGVSDLWGWTDPDTGREYALVGRQGGAAFVDISTPAAPRYLGSMAAPVSGARDLKVYRDHLFLTGDGAGPHGLMVFDLTRLREVRDAPADFEPDAVYEKVVRAHNLIIDTESGFAFTVGSSGGGETCGGGLHMVDIRDPKNPVFAGCYTDTEGLIYAGRTHDAQCTVYRGPDEDYQGRQLCFASNETALRIVDVSDKANPVPIAAARYPGMGYVHQGWLTEDQRYFYLDDELDELIGTTDRTRTLIWDLSDLDDPELVGEVLGPTASTDHNLYVKGDRMYQANYQAGLRVLDVSDPEAPLEVGYFDTTPYVGDPPGFVGAWTAFPFFESGTVVVSSMTEGLFILKPRRTELVP